MNLFRKTVFYMNYIWLGVLLMFSYSTLLDGIPDQIYSTKNEETGLGNHLPVTFSREDNSEEVLWNVRGQEGKEILVCKFLGLIPLKKIEVNYVEPRKLYAGGEPVGIYVKTNGVLVVGTGQITTDDGIVDSPCENIIKSGDYICGVNSTEIEDKEAMINVVNNADTDVIELDVLRNSEKISLTVKPVEINDTESRLGIWIRDDMAGIGTLTYIKENLEYGALGHGVSDADTNDQISMEWGKLYRTNIMGIIKGSIGTPGELSGMINYTDTYKLGSIQNNLNSGIYGTLDQRPDSLKPDNLYEIAGKQEIEVGAARLISSVSGEKREYDINITQVNYNSEEEHKSILFEVTDPELINLTGGIIQGMSGSPIIQNGKIIGAVTHVFVSDPTKGYGIFIETMLEKDV